MSEFVDRALALWDGNAAAQDDAVDRFREVYADPLTVNGALVPLSGMVGRARAMGEAFTDRRTVVHEVVEGDGHSRLRLRDPCPAHRSVAHQ